MARLIYGNEIFVMSDKLGTEFQATLIQIINQGTSTWFPIPHSGDEHKHYVTELLFGPGIPVRFEYEFSSEADMQEHLAAALQRAAEMGHAPEK